jgi:hypothetical protein
MMPAFGEALLHVKFLQRDLARALRIRSNNWNAPCPISQKSLQELEWWLKAASLKNNLPNRRKPPAPDLNIYVDASSSGWGVSSASTQIAGFWFVEEKEDSVNACKLKNSLFTLQVHIP